ncbi:MAG: hypothetical protein IJM46_09955 [Oscillospiraceae bacterium]|nr:hypothetical protein [Oscillospiraceae bacterium]
MPNDSMYNRNNSMDGVVFLRREKDAMTEKELRKAKKADLIEMLYYLRTEIDELKAENDMLRAKVIMLSGGISDTEEKQDV